MSLNMPRHKFNVDFEMLIIVKTVLKSVDICCFIKIQTKPFVNLRRQLIQIQWKVVLLATQIAYTKSYWKKPEKHNK